MSPTSYSPVLRFHARAVFLSFVPDQKKNDNSCGKMSVIRARAGRVPRVGEPPAAVGVVEQRPIDSF